MLVFARRMWKERALQRHIAHVLAICTTQLSEFGFGNIFCSVPQSIQERDTEGAAYSAMLMFCFIDHGKFVEPHFALDDLQCYHHTFSGAALTKDGGLTQQRGPLGLEFSDLSGNCFD